MASPGYARDQLGIVQSILASSCGVASTGRSPRSSRPPWRECHAPGAESRRSHRLSVRRSATPLGSRRCQLGTSAQSLGHPADGRPEKGLSESPEWESPLLYAKYVSPTVSCGGCLIDFASTLGAGALGSVPTACHEYSVDVGLTLGRRTPQEFAPIVAGSSFTLADVPQPVLRG